MPPENVCCPLCRRDDCAVIVTGVRCHYRSIPGEFQYVRCRCCGMHYLNPRLSESDLGRAYEKIQQEGPPPGEAPASKSRLKSLLQGWWQRVNNPWPVLRYIQTGPVLDVGCNYGQFLDVLRQRGWECEGLEFNARAVESCRARGHHVLQGDIQSTDLEANKYGSIVLMHTLEHLPEPLAVMAKLKNWLKPSGQLLVVVPYIHSPMRKKFGRFWHGWDPPFHLTHYDIPTMKMIAEKTGLQHERSILRMSAEDYTRSMDLKQDTSKRRLFTRMFLLPWMKLKELFGHGSYLITIFSK